MVHKGPDELLESFHSSCSRQLAIRLRTVIGEKWIAVEDARVVQTSTSHLLFILYPPKVI